MLVECSKSGATPRRRKTQAVIPRDDASRKGTLTKRGNADQERERAPRHHKLASAIADCGFYEFRRQLTYKCEWLECELVIADRFYPSSRICSECGHQQKMPLHLRTYKCTKVDLLLT